MQLFPYLQEREKLYLYCHDRLEAFAAAHSCRLLETPDNPISFALTLDSLAESGDETQLRGLPITQLGSMLFHRCVSGTRVIGQGVQQEVAGVTFNGYGAHCDQYPHDYLTVAAALGTSQSDVDLFLVRLDTCFKHFRKQNERKADETAPSGLQL